MPGTDNANALPDDLPVPIDDGACDHLKAGGLALPRGLALAATDGRSVDLATLAGQTVVYCYPRTGEPDKGSPAGWDEIPGARGCTPESCAFRDHFAELRALGVDQLFGLSTQETDYQKEAAARLHLPFALLSDADLRFVTALRLPTFATAGMTLVKRLTLVLHDGVMQHCFYPVFPPDQHAGEVVAWFRQKAARGRLVPASEQP